MKTKKPGPLFNATFIAILILVSALFIWKNFTSPKIENVLLISIDTCRADYLGCYGFNKNTSPTLDSLADNGLLFENTFTPIPLTLPAHTSMLTGTYPLYHKVHDNINYRVDESNLTLPEILKEHGYSTAAIISAYVLYPQFGLNQGFETYNSEFINPIIAGSNRDTERRGDEATDLAVSYFEQHKDDPFFMFLHYYDPHTDYAPPSPYKENFKDDPYSGEIAFTDNCISRVIEKLKKLNLYNKTLIVIVGDHGEALGEHGETEHGYFIYRCSTHVPFIVKVPGMKKGKRIKDVASLVDVTPTILGYLGISIPKHMQGKDLSAYSSGKNIDAKDRAVFIESLTPTRYDCNPLLELATINYDYIETTKPELYDLAKDKSQLNNIVEDQTGRQRLMRGRLQDMMTDLISKNVTGGKTEIDEESRRRLESLGYIGGSSITESFELDPNKKDAKDIIDYYEMAHLITYLKYHAKFDEAIEVCKKMEAGWPEITNTYFMFCQLCSAIEDHKKTLEYGDKYMSLITEKITSNGDTDGFSVNRSAAMAYQLMGKAAFELKDSDRALGYWKKGLELKPQWPEVYNNLAAAYEQKNDTENAILYLTKALQLRPDWTDTRNNISRLQAKKELEQKIADLLDKATNNPQDPNAHDTLAKLYYQQNNMAEAIKYWRKAFELDSQNTEVCNNLAWTLATAADINLRSPAEAVILAQKCSQLTDYKKPEILDTLAVAYASDNKFPQAVETAQKALKLANENQNEALIKEIKSHLDIFTQNKKYGD